MIDGIGCSLPAGATMCPMTGRRSTAAPDPEAPRPQRAARSPYPSAVDELITEFAGLPGIGRRTAERLAFHIIKSSEPEAMALARAIADVKHTVRHCSICFNLTAQDPCPICSDPRRDQSLILVVEQPKDLIALEQTGLHRGVYHVLMGRLSPLDDIGPEDITVNELIRRLDDPARNSGGATVREVVFGLNPTLEGDGTALMIAEEVRRRGIAASRLARGLPSGSQLEYVNKAVLADALQGRQPMI